MSRFKNRKGKDRPMISTASLPDIVFMLLFFFMVVTVIRQKEILVDITLPEATEITKLVNPQEAEHIYIGQPINEVENAASVIQINDKFVKLEQVHYSVADPAKENEVIALEVDRDVSMGIVTDVKTEIRKANRLRVHYIANREME